MSRALIFVADLLEVLDKLEIDSPGTAREVMRMLSLESWADIAAAPEANRAVAPIGATEAAVPTVVHEGPAPEVGGTSPSGSVAPLSTKPAAVTALDPAPLAAVRPHWALPDRAMQRALPYLSPVVDSLLDPRQERTAVAALVAGVADDETIDLDAVVLTLARGEPLDALPMRRGWNLRRGLHVLIDQGPGMAPFRADAEQFVSRLDRLMAPDLLAIGMFEGTPLHGVRMSARKPAPWQPPAPQTPVLLLTDLGLCPADRPSRAVTASEWIEFSQAARRAGVQLRTLVPYPPKRWPSALAVPMGCVAWDRRTTAATVRRALWGSLG
ncbi:hypothetical protein GCM10023165_42050 [Variovorax defluvii]|uniref:Uncharacterized protein n=1 Tax=Variovorax defluvii TaxID=913761 RepID=A0ABP8I7C9_9BURK